MLEMVKHALINFHSWLDFHWGGGANGHQNKLNNTKKAFYIKLCSKTQLSLYMYVAHHILLPLIRKTSSPCLRWWCDGGGDRAWWVIESVFLRSPDKGVLSMSRGYTPRRPETWVSLCNLMLKLFVNTRSSAILGSDSPQSNNRKDHSLWVTPFIPRERPYVKHAIAGHLGLTRGTWRPTWALFDSQRHVFTENARIFPCRPCDCGV